MEKLIALAVSCLHAEWRHTEDPERERPKPALQPGLINGEFYPVKNDVILGPDKVGCRGRDIARLEHHKLFILEPDGVKLV